MRETTFTVPKSWRARVHPWPGDDGGTEPDPLAEEFLRERIAAMPKHFTGDGELGAQLRAYLAGTGTPLGAAALVAVLHAIDRTEGQERIADALIGRHGLLFTVEVAARLGEVHAAHALVGARLVRQMMTVAPMLERLRRLLAGVRAGEFDAVAEVLARHRATGLGCRVVAAYLVPTRVDWVDEVCREAVAITQQYSWPGQDLLLQSLSTGGQYTLLVTEASFWFKLASEERLRVAAARIGPSIAPGVASLLDRHKGSKPDRRRLLKLLGQLPTDEAFGLMLARVDQPLVRPVLLDMMNRFPERAARLLAAAGETSLLRDHLVAHPGIAPPDGLAVMPGVPEATDLPSALVDPPWTRRREPVVLPGLQPIGQPAACWTPGEREEWAASPVDECWSGTFPDWDQAMRQYRGFQLPWYQEVWLFTRGPAEVIDPVLESWRPLHTSAFEWGRPFAARHGIAGLPVLQWVASKAPAHNGELLLPFADASVAQLMAEWLVRNKGARPTAEAWLRRHAEFAAAALVPAALGRPGRHRSEAEAALLFLDGVTDVQAAAREYGEEAAQAIEGMLALGELGVLPAKMPALPTWAHPGMFPQILMRDKETALPVAAVGHLLTMLRISTVDSVYAGIRVVQDLCDPASLASFAWDLFERWRDADSPAKESWAFTALGVLGDDDTVRALTPLIRAWPGENGHAKAVLGLDVLAAIGTGMALTHLHRIAQKLPFKALKERAEEKITAVAAGLGLTADQLADRLVPAFGLDETASLMIDYGSRRFTVGFDESLQPYVLDGDGKRRKDLPKPGVKDDPALAPIEYKRFTTLKKDVRGVAAGQIARLESAMLSQREWPAEEFVSLLAEHPLLGHIVRRLVWRTNKGETFRLAEDRTPVDVNDEPWTLPEDATVSVAHPVQLTDVADRWAGVFADYEIIQPFPQLDRPAYVLTPQEMQATRLDRFHGMTVPSARLLGLANRGWRRGDPQDHSVERWITRPVPGGGSVVLTLNPGITTGHGSDNEHQILTDIWLCPPGDRFCDPRDRRVFGELDPVTASELLAELSAITLSTATSPTATSSAVTG
ncbi:DUF4132 domain-containing protein [Actinocrispum sp. NPDC049592]|uniref:DUF4132 domain-containing protein n=1 Tax=Actinocrispum sp. NPDC049592 TaxID=3154835 RepID=UPI00341903A4